MIPARTISDLRDCFGIEVRVQHFRRYRKGAFTDAVITSSDRGWARAVAGVPPEPRGGRTLVELLNDRGQLVAGGEAVCSEHDNYCKRLGLQIALGRAMKSLGPRVRLG